MSRKKDNLPHKATASPSQNFWHVIRNLLFPPRTHQELWQYLDNKFFMHATSQPLTDATLLIELALQQRDANSNYTKTQLRQALTQLKYLQSLFHLDAQMALKDQTFNLQQTLNEVVLRHHQPQHAKVVTPVFQLPSNPHISGNAFLFQEAVTCLINNGFEAYDTDQPNKYVLLTAYEKQDCAILIIGDTGAGIDLLTQHLMHLKGFTLKKTGHGLGVSYAHKIITQHLGGTCKLVSYPDLGTLFMISLPLKR